MTRKMLDTDAVQENKEMMESKETSKSQSSTDENKYANLFADWDLLPPQVMIRRVRRK